MFQTNLSDPTITFTILFSFNRGNSGEKYLFCTSLYLVTSDYLIRSHIFPNFVLWVFLGQGTSLSVIIPTLDIYFWHGHKYFHSDHLHFHHFFHLYFRLLSPFLFWHHFTLHLYLLFRLIFHLCLPLQWQ